MNTNSVLVSVIVPVYNGARFLAEAAASIRSQANVAVEIIVVDDGSTDETARVAASLGSDVRYCYQANQGPGAARNRGLALATGDLLAFLDADDVWPPGSLERRVAALLEDEAREMVLGRTQLLMEAPGRPGEFALDERVWVAAQLGALMVRHAAVQRAGLFDAGLYYGEDLDWYMRIRELGAPNTIMPDVTLYYRIHDQSITKGKNPLELNMAVVLKRSIDRRRQLRAAAPDKGSR